MNLMIIEGAGKVGKISGFVKDLNIKVFATKGHIRELDDSVNDGYGFEFFGVNAFSPNWKILGSGTKNSKNGLVKEMLSLADQAEKIYIATDPDREGEAIAYHIFELLKNNKSKAVRITFNAINKQDILNAINHQRQIDNNLVDAAICRTVYDKFLGYQLSTMVRNIIQAKKMSAGRVQSVVLKMICMREDEIKNYKEKNWWTYEPVVRLKEGLDLKLKLKAELDEISKSQIEVDDDFDDEEEKLSKFEKTFDSEEKVKVFMDKLDDSFKFINFEIDDELLSKPSKPLITSDLLTLAAKNLKLNAKSTTEILQRLYEKGLISYPRTDSTRVSEDCCKEFYKYVLEKYGEKYADDSFWFNKLKQKDGVQDGHECLRVSHLNIDNEIEFLKNGGEVSDWNIYSLIWKRSAQIFFKSAVYKKTNLLFENKGFVFNNESKVLMFDGYLKIVGRKEGKEISLDEEYLKSCLNHFFEQINKKWDAVIKHKDSCPKRFDTGTLIKKLEQVGVGRPSTYSTMAEINIERENVDLVKENNIKVMKVNEKGDTLNRLLQKIAPNLINEKFTSQFELDLDKIANEKLNWKECIKKYVEMVNDIKSLNNEELLNKEYGLKKEKVVGVCPKCGAETIEKVSKTGTKFIVCRNRKYDLKTKEVSGCDYLEWMNKK